MSWSISFIGRPELVAKALDEQSEKFSGQSRVEYDDAKPHLIALVKQNFAAEGSGYNAPLVKLDASGSGSASTGQTSSGPPVEAKQLQRQCIVRLETFYSTPLL